MTLSANTVLGIIIIAAILAAYVIARRMNQRQHDARMASFSRRIQAAEQRDREQS